MADSTYRVTFADVSTDTTIGTLPVDDSRLQFMIRVSGVKPLPVERSSYIRAPWRAPDTGKRIRLRRHASSEEWRLFSDP
jgi:hypothetical protein